MNNNVVGWFEIPVADMDRAVKFYETVLDLSFSRHPMGELEMAWFPGTEDGLGASGSLVRQPEYYTPSADGTLVYFTSPSGNLANELERVEQAGGKVLQPKTLITEDIGYMALFLDTEGNKLALHSRA